MISELLTINFPHWPMHRLISESLAEWRGLHPHSGDLSLEEAPWELVFEAIVSFLRHRHTNYDDVVSPQIRGQLHEQILKAARQRYPWLRRKTDPRQTDKFALAQKADPDKDLHFDYLSKRNCELLTEREQLQVALRSTSDSVRRRELKLKIEQLTIAINRIYDRCAATLPLNGGHKTDWGMRSQDHKMGQYNLDGLPEYKTRLARFQCSKCGKAVLRSGQRIDYGGGRKLYLYSCHCASVAFSSHPPPEIWMKFALEAQIMRALDAAWENSREKYGNDRDAFVNGPEMAEISRRFAKEFVEMMDEVEPYLCPSSRAD